MLHISGRNPMSAMAFLVVFTAPFVDLSGQARRNTSTRSASARISATGGVDGDVYLMMQDGDTKRGAGRTIFLLRDDEALRNSIAAACNAYAPVRDSLNRRVEILHDSIMAAQVLRKDLDNSTEADHASTVVFSEPLG